MRKSERTTATERFLSLCLENAFELDWLDADGFVSSFGPPVLMEYLEAASELRAKVLVEAAGVNPKIAKKKSTAAAAEDLQLALEEELCTPADVLHQLSFDELVQWLPPVKLWQFLTHDAFYEKNDSRSRERMLFMLEAAQFEDLLDPTVLLRALTPELVTMALPKELVDEALTQALVSGMDGVAFSPENLVEVLPLSTWLEHLRLSDVWAQVVEKEVLATTDWLAPNVAAAKDAPARAQGSLKSKSTKTGDSSTRESKAGTGLEHVDDVTDAASDAAPAVTNTPEETQARRQAISHLSERGRLPKKASELSTPLLLAIETMYVDLQGLQEENEQAEVIFEAFPNEGQLMEAMFALAETLDPKLTAQELKSRGIDARGAVQIVLFEEHKRQHLAKKKSSVPPPPASSVAAKPSTPPPLPAQARKASTPPPPLPAQARGTRSRG